MTSDALWGRYDVLTIASAYRAGCNVLFSDYLNARKTPAGTRIMNPFAAHPERLSGRDVSPLVN